MLKIEAPKHDCPLCKAPANWEPPRSKSMLPNQAKPMSNADSTYFAAFACRACGFMALLSDDILRRLAKESVAKNTN
jgi:rubrerythrin